MTAFIGLFFGGLLVAAILGIAKIQRAEYFAAREAKEEREARIKEFRAKCYRPDGD